jgi:hypothetical protein
MRQTEKKKARLGRYGHPDFVGQFKPAATFPIFFSNEYLDEGFQVSFLSGIEHAIVGDIPANDLFPCSGKGRFSEFFAAMIGKPVKHRAPCRMDSDNYWRLRKKAFPLLKDNLFYSDRNQQNTCRDGGLVRQVPFYKEFGHVVSCPEDKKTQHGG